MQRPFQNIAGGPFASANQYFLLNFRRESPIMNLGMKRFALPTLNLLTTTPPG